MQCQQALCACEPCISGALSEKLDGRERTYRIPGHVKELRLFLRHLPHLFRESFDRSPASVKVPNGILDKITAGWNGRLEYDPGLIRAPILTVRGEWDSLCTDIDAKWFFDALSASPLKRDVKIGRATHLMLLEEGRFALYRETQTFLEGENK